MAIVVLTIAHVIAVAISGTMHLVPHGTQPSAAVTFVPAKCMVFISTRIHIYKTGHAALCGSRDPKYNPCLAPEWWGVVVNVECVIWQLCNACIRPTMYRQNASAHTSWTKMAAME